MDNQIDFTDPTYLRYIHDGLAGGSINAENTSVLPTGLVGMYEEAFPDSMASEDRRQLLKFFTVWALLRKEASAGLVAKILDSAEDKVTDQVAAHSSWFTSPVSGRYTLYHERLRAFVLQKITAPEMSSINESIITCCREALSRRLGDEDEQYALEFLGTHLLTAAMADPIRGTELKKLAYDTLHWDRQLAVSKRFDWSRRLLREMMQWAYMHEREEVIECALNRVDLHHREQNDAPRIVELVAEGDIETALQRIDAFGGMDKEGLQRKFILYMLCLMEVTLLENKDRPFSRNACERLLKHLDDNIPVDHSILKWNDFFSSYLIFEMACEWAELQLDYLVVYKRSDKWEREWIAEKGPYSELQCEVLLSCVREISASSEKSEALKGISAELAKQGKSEEAIQIALGISDDSDKSCALAAISTELVRQGNLGEAAAMMQEALKFAQGIGDDYLKSIALKNISAELAKHGKDEEALTCARGIGDDWQSSSAIAAISTELVRQGKFGKGALAMQEALEIAQGVEVALINITWELAKQEKVKEALAIALAIIDEEWKSDSLVVISTELAHQGKTEEALQIGLGVSHEFRKIKMQVAISSEFAKQGKISRALEIALGIRERSFVNKALNTISIEQAKQGKVKKAIEIALGISDESYKCIALTTISIELVRQGKEKVAALSIHEALKSASGIKDERWRRVSLDSISSVLAKQGKIKELLEITQVVANSSESEDQGTLKNEEFLSDVELSLLDDMENSLALVANSAELAKQGKSEEAIQIALGISDDSDKICALAAISTELVRQGNLGEAAAMMQEALKFAQGIGDDYLKSIALKNISAELAKQGKNEEALACVYGISDDFEQSSALASIATELAQQEKKVVAETVGIEIPKRAVRQDCWKTIAKASVEKDHWKTALQGVQAYKSFEARLFYLKGWSEHVSVSDVTAGCLAEALPWLVNDIESIEALLQKYAVQEVFLGQPSPALQQRLNRTLNIQWAIDIKNSISAA